MLINKKTGDIYLTGEITNHLEVDEVCDFILNYDSKINLMINSGGGSMGLAIQLINTIRAQPVTGIVLGRAFSAAASIALSCKDLIVSQGSALFFHGPQITTEEDHDGAANFGSYIDYLNNEGSYITGLLQPFLTVDEISFLNNCGEIYISGNDPTLNERIERHFNKKVN